MVGSAWTPWLRPTVIGVLELEGALLQRLEQAVDVGDEEIGGAHELNVEAGVEHVR